MIYSTKDLKEELSMQLRPLDELTKGSHPNLIIQIDHTMYAAVAKDEKSFLDSWSKLGFKEHSRISTQKHSAAHFALVSGKGEALPWAVMACLVVSNDPECPVNHFLSRNGEGVLYTAYAVNPQVDMDELHDRMKALGWRLMTPVLTYEDSGGPRLRYLFLAPSKPYGPFIGFVQRPVGADGKVFQEFDVMLLDTLYDYYDSNGKS